MPAPIPILVPVFDLPKNSTTGNGDVHPKRGDSLSLARLFSRSRSRHSGLPGCGELAGGCTVESRVRSTDEAWSSRE